MSCQAVRITRVIRPMRGGSQAQLVQADDGRYYVAKFAGNPQGSRTLINEWITSQLLRRFSVSTPPLLVLRLEDELLESTESLHFAVGGRRIPVGAGLHLGSLCPVDPVATAILDFLPQHLIHKVVNLADFAKLLVFDAFLAHADSRQAIFVRESRPKGLLGFRAYFVDHGMTLGGNRWELRDLLSQGLYFDRKVYSYIDMAAVCEQACRDLDGITEDDLYLCVQDIPSAWFAPGDHDALASLLTLLQRRKARLRTLVSNLIETLALGQKVPLRQLSHAIHP
jgi:hypothetical protein